MKGESENLQSSFSRIMASAYWFVGRMPQADRWKTDCSGKKRVAKGPNVISHCNTLGKRRERPETRHWREDRDSGVNARAISKVEIITGSDELWDMVGEGGEEPYKAPSL